MAQHVGHGRRWSRPSNPVGRSTARPWLARQKGKQSDLRSVLSRASWTAVLQATSSGAGFLTSLLLARFLSTDEYGLYVVAFAWAGVLGSVGTLGFDRFLVRGMAVYELRSQWPLMRGLLRRTNEIVAGASMIIAVTGCLVAVVALNGPLKIPFSVAMLLIPITSLTLVRQGAMQALGRVVSGQFPEYFLRPILIIVVIPLMAVGWGPTLTATSALTVNVAAVTVALVLGAYMLRQALPAQVREAEPRYDQKAWLGAAVPMMFISGAWILNNYVGIVMMGALGGAAQAAVYSVVQSIAGLIVLFLVATNMPLAPIAANLHARGSREELERVTERVARIGLYVSVPVCIVVALVPGIFLSVFGPSFAVGETALRVVALAQLVNAAAGPAGNVLIMSGNERSALLGIGGGVVVNIVAAAVLIPLLGVTGGGIAFAASLITWNVALVAIARVRLGINVTAFGKFALQEVRRERGF